MSFYYDRQGQPIDLYTWGRLLEDHEYKVIEHTMVGQWLVSTVWLGLDHNHWGKPPLIFETMVFDGAVPGRDMYREWEVRRYATEEDARRGHSDMVSLVEALDGVRESQS